MRCRIHSKQIPPSFDGIHNKWNSAAHHASVFRCTKPFVRFSSANGQGGLWVINWCEFVADVVKLTTCYDAKIDSMQTYVSADVVSQNFLNEQHKSLIMLQVTQIIAIALKPKQPQNWGLRSTKRPYCRMRISTAQMCIVAGRQRFNSFA